MLNQKLSDQLCQSILYNKMSFEQLVSFLHNYPFVKHFLNDNYFKVPMVFNSSPGLDSICSQDDCPEESSYKPFSLKQTPVVLEIPCVHYLLLLFKKDSEQFSFLLNTFTIQPFQISYLHKNEKKYSLLGINLYNLFNLKINDSTMLQLPLIANNKEEFYNFYCEKMKGNQYFYTDNDSFFPLFNFKITVEDFNYNNNNMTLETRSVALYLFGQKVITEYKNLDELSHHQRIPLDNLLEYKIKMQEIEFDFTVNDFLDLLVMKNYFNKSIIHNNSDLRYLFPLTLAENNPHLFTPDIMALICLKNFELHELIVKKIPSSYSSMNTYSLYPTETQSQQSITVHNYSSFIKETQFIIDKLMTTDDTVLSAWNNLKLHIESIYQDNGIAFLTENLEDRLTFDNIITKYIPSILNNYLSIPAHLRNKDNTNFVSMTVSQLQHIEKELEKIELAIIEEDVKKMKIFGRFLDNRLGHNSADIITLV